MMRTTVPRWLLATTGILAAWVLPAADRPTAHAAEPAAAKLIPVTAEAIAGREKSLAENAPEGAKLLAYLDCGSQQQSTTGKEVTIVCLAGVPYRFPSEAKDVLPSQSTVFYSTAEVPFRIDGLKRSERYVVGLSWWDYDNGGRTQSVVTGSPDGRLVRLAIPAIGLPNYTDAGQLPVERRFPLSVAFVRDGQLRLTVKQVTGANVVISELWIWGLGAGE